MTRPSVVRVPAGALWEIEFTPGVWTPVTKDVDSAGSIRYGRTSEFSQPQPAGFQVPLVLRNFQQQYTPQNPASPYFPNVTRRKRIRYSYNTAGTQRFRFTGFIKQWQPLLKGQLAYMQITAACQMDQLARVTMLSPIRQEITLTGPKLWWPMTDDQSSVVAVEQSGNGGPPLAPAGVGATAPVFGDNGPGFGDGTGVKFSATGRFLTANVPGMLIPISSQSFTFEFWAQTSSATDQVPVFMADTAGSMTLSLTIAGGSTGRPSFNLSGTAGITGSTSVVDGNWHHYCVDYDGGGTWTLYVDGASVGTLASAHSALNLITVGQITGNMGQLAVYSAPLAGLDGSTVFQHAAAGRGYAGDRTDVRISRFLGFANIGDIGVLDTGQATVNTYPQDGRDVVSGCGDMATTEGGGAVFYITPDGRPRFANRRYRDSRTPKLIIDAVVDLEPSVYQPSLDDANLVTRMTANRATQSGTQTSQTYDSGATDVFADEVTTYTTGTTDGNVDGDGDALNLVRNIVTLQAGNALRFPQIAIDLTKAGHDLYDAIGQLGIGDRIRLGNIPPNAYPLPTLDFFLEGWTEQPGIPYLWVADVSAADNPPRGMWDVSTWDSADAFAL